MKCLVPGQKLVTIFTRFHTPSPPSLNRSALFIAHDGGKGEIATHMRDPVVATAGVQLDSWI